MSHEHPYPDYAYLERDPETDERRWFGTKGMGVCYIHEDRAAEDIEAAVQAERERCAKLAETATGDFARDTPSRTESSVRAGIAAAIRSRSDSQ